MTTSLTARLTTLTSHTPGRRSALVSQWEQVLLGFLLAIAMTMFVMQGFSVSGECMEPHLYTGERVLANKMAYRLAGPSRGDIVIFDYPKDTRQVYVKRVIGLPGDTVSIHDGRVFINGKHLPEPYRVFAAHGGMAPRLIPRDQYFMMGDNRDVSDDSRYWGELPRQDIIGRAVACYWPPAQAQMLR